MKSNNPKQIALGGMLAAMAIVIMCMVGMIPLATYICPVLCILLQFIVLQYCGRRIAWAWYAAVAILSLLLSPDREAAAVFLALGYYPVIKPKLDSARFAWLWKMLLFNGAVSLLYGLLLKLMGLDVVASEREELGIAGLMILLILGNVTFILVDRVLLILRNL